MTGERASRGPERRPRHRTVARRLASVAGRVRYGRPVRLAGRVLTAAGVAAAAVMASGHGPAGPASITGALTWLLLTARRDLAAPGDLRRGEPGERREHDERGQLGQPRSAPVATGLAGSADQADHDPT
jgi:hypothetical protein